MTMKWLVSFDIKTAGVETDKHLLVQADCLAMAERGVKQMGATWWPELQQDEGGHWWCFDQGEVWFSALTLLEDVEFSLLQGLRFLSLWQVSETPDGVILRDVFGHCWQDHRR